MTDNNNNDSFDYKKESSLLLSYELLRLLQWLMQHEIEALKALTEKAVAAGYRDNEITKNNFIELQVSDQHIYQSIIDFLDLMDFLLAEAEQSYAAQKGYEMATIPAIKHIDTKTCGKDLVQKTLEHTSLKLRTNPDQNAQEVMLKELLKRWRPGSKKALLN